MVRYVTADTNFETERGQNFLIREGDRIAIYPPALHKDPEIFEDPLVSKASVFSAILVGHLLVCSQCRELEIKDKKTPDPKCSLTNISRCVDIRDRPYESVPFETVIFVVSCGHGVARRAEAGTGAPSRARIVSICSFWA